MKNNRYLLPPRKNIICWPAGQPAFDCVILRFSRWATTLTCVGVLPCVRYNLGVATARTVTWMHYSYVQLLHPPALSPTARAVVLAMRHCKHPVHNPDECPSPNERDTAESLKKNVLRVLGVSRTKVPQAMHAAASVKTNMPTPKPTRAFIIDCCTTLSYYHAINIIIWVLILIVQTTTTTVLSVAPS